MLCNARVEGPDFICVGMPKAGTGWLFDQLQYHPDFWMPPLKGMHYLDHEVPTMKNAVKKLRRLEQGLAHERADRRKGDERDLIFLRDAASLAAKPLDLSAYSSLFRHKGDLLSGDITAPYYSIPEKVIADIGKYLPRTKIILLIREPVARAWSNISMAYREGRFDTSLLDTPAKFREFIQSAKATKEKLPSNIARRWMEHAPRVEFRHFFFDDIEQDPAGARHQILSYLGAQTDAKSGEIPASYNRKGSAAKLVLSDPIREILIDYFKSEIRACAQLFGGHAYGWVSRYGL